jgi:hypothetical protein
MEKLSDLQRARNAESPKKRWVEPVTALLNGPGNTEHGLVLISIGGVDSPEQSADERIQRLGAKGRPAEYSRSAGSHNSHRHVYATACSAQAGNEKLASFHADRLPPDVRKAYDAWMAQHPFENPKADPHPFVPNLYHMRGTAEAAQATATSVWAKSKSPSRI